MNDLLGGVMDFEERRGFLCIGGSEVAAIDLASGRVLWRNEAIGRPLAASRNWLVALGGDGQSLQAVDARTGRAAYKVPAPAFPEWARDAFQAQGAYEVFGEEAGDDLLIGWELQRLYTGGAAPGAEVEAQLARPPAAGMIRLDLKCGASRPEPARPPQAKPSQAVASAAPPSAPPVAGELARTRTGSHEYILRAQPDVRGDIEVKVEAQDLERARTLWEADLGTIAPSMPPARRP